MDVRDLFWSCVSSNESVIFVTSVSHMQRGWSWSERRSPCLNVVLGAWSARGGWHRSCWGWWLTVVTVDGSAAAGICDGMCVCVCVWWWWWCCVCVMAVRLLGFVTNVDEWMVAADILVTKAGPGTIAEACCCQTPILLFDYLPGQEEGNVTFVCERGMGEEEKVAGNVAQRCLEWVRDPAKLARFRQAAREQAQPTSAIDIARMTLEILQEEARLNEHEASTADEPAAAGGGGGEGAQGGQGKSRLGRSHSEGDIAQCGDADRTSDVKYQYVYRTAWWSWLSPFNHER